MLKKAIVPLIFLAILLTGCASNANRQAERARAEQARIAAEQAIAYYTEAIRLNPNNVSAFNRRGNVHFSRGNFTRAIADYSEAIRLNPNCGVLRTNRGHAYRMSGNYARAIANFEAALRIDPNYPRARQQLQATRGQGSIHVTSQFRTYRTETRVREYEVPGVFAAAAGRTGVIAYSPARTETVRYTVRVPVTGDSNLPFRILVNGVETFRGVTPITVTNFDHGVTYTIVWTARNGARMEGTFVIPAARPFRRNIHID